MYIHDFLRSRGVWFEALLYQPASSSAKRARNARITGRSVAKAVLVRAGNSFLLAVLPASCRIDLDRLSQVLGSPGVGHPAGDSGRTAGDVSRLRAGGRPSVRAALRSVDAGGLRLFGNRRHRRQRQHAPRRSLDAFPRLRGDRRAGAGVIQPADLVWSRAVDPSKRDENRRAGVGRPLSGKRATCRQVGRSDAFRSADRRGARHATGAGRDATAVLLEQGAKRRRGDRHKEVRRSHKWDIVAKGDTHAPGRRLHPGI